MQIWINVSKLNVNNSNKLNLRNKFNNQPKLKTEMNIHF